MSKKILIFTTSEGHLSIAKAVRDFLINSFDCEVVFREELGLKLYKYIYTHYPHFFSFFFSFSKNSVVSILLKYFTSTEHYQFIKGIIDKLKPEIVINTSFGFTSSIERVVLSQQFKIINIIPNPRTFFKQDISAQSLNCVFDEQTAKDVKAISPSANIAITGWFVQEKFEEQYDQKSTRSELGLDSTKPIFLIVSGSEGTESVIDLIKRVSQFPQIQLVVACGKNNKMLQDLTLLSQTSLAAIIPIPFTNQMHKYMQAADLVVGKAGPNMIFESVATQTPFLATSHVGGLEDGNLEIIEKYQIGVVEEDSERAAQKIKEFAENPTILSTFLPAIKKLSEYNKNQRKVLLKHLD